MAEEAGVELPMPPSISIAIETAGDKHSSYTINDGGCCQCGIGIMIEEVPWLDMGREKPWSDVHGARYFCKCSRPIHKNHHTATQPAIRQGSSGNARPVLNALLNVKKASHRPLVMMLLSSLNGWICAPSLLSQVVSSSEPSADMSTVNRNR